MTQSVFIVLAHRIDAQLDRLISRLLQCDAGVIVHVDRRTPGTLPAQTDRLRFLTQRYPTAWGSYETVLATLALMREARRSFHSARHVSLLSGQCYPIKSPSHIDGFLARADCDFLTARPLLSEEWRYGGKRRLDRYYWARNRKSTMGFLWRALPLPPRRFPIPPDEMHYGSQWWTMRSESADAVLDFTLRNPRILRAFRWTYIPDELFFQTVLCNYLGMAVADDNLRHIVHFALPRDWLRMKIRHRNGIRLLGMSDLEALRNSTALFARKFDFTSTPELPNHLDEMAESASMAYEARAR